MFGAYDHTNDKMNIHCYQKETGKQFVDFLKRLDRRYDKTIKNIFLVLDNLSVHKSKKVKERLSKTLPKNKICILTGKISEVKPD